MRALLLLILTSLGLMLGCQPTPRDYVGLSARKLAHHRLNKAGAYAWHNIDQRNSLAGYWLSGVVAARQKNWAWATISTERAWVLTNHQNDSLRYNYGLILLQRGLAHQALPYLEGLQLKAVPGYQLAYHQALAYYLTGKWVNALVTLDTTQHPLSEQVRYLQGCLYERLQNYRQASQCFDRLQRPGRFPGIQLGRVYFFDRQYARALPHFQRATRQKATADSAHLGVGFCQLELKQYAKAKEAFGQITPSPIRTYAEGFLLFRMGQDSLAQLLFAQVVKQRPYFVPARLGQAHLLMRQKRYAEAERSYSALLAQSPSADIYEYRGMACFRQFDYRKPADTLLLVNAKNDFRQARKLNPNHAFSYDAYISMGYAYVYEFYRQQRESFGNPAQRLDVSRSLFEAAIRQSPRRPEAHEGLGICLFFTKAYEQAVEAFDQALAIRDSPMTRTSRGLSYFAQDDYKAARRDFDQVIAADPQNALAWNGHGLVSMQDSMQYAVGYSQLRQASALADPQNPLEKAAILFNLVTAKGYHFPQSGYEQTPEGFSQFITNSLQPAFSRIRLLSSAYTDDAFRVQYGYFAGREYGFLTLSDQYLKGSGRLAARLNEGMNQRRRCGCNDLEIATPDGPVRPTKYIVYFAPFLPYNLPPPPTDFENRYMPQNMEPPLVMADYLYPKCGQKLLPAPKKREGVKKKSHGTACPIV